MFFFHKNNTVIFNENRQYLYKLKLIFILSFLNCIKTMYKLLEILRRFNFGHLAYCEQKTIYLKKRDN